MGLTRNDLVIGNIYYYGNCIRGFKCISKGEVQSVFIDYKDSEHQFYNHDMYISKRSV